MRRILAIAAAFVFAACAADVTGTWKATGESEVGAVERTFVFHVDGAKLTGETTGNLTGKSTIENGKIEGDQISFSIRTSIQGHDVTIRFTGKISGSEIKFHAEVEGLDRSVDYVAKKVS